MSNVQIACRVQSQRSDPIEFQITKRAWHARVDAAAMTDRPDRHPAAGAEHQDLLCRSVVGHVQFSIGRNTEGDRPCIGGKCYGYRLDATIDGESHKSSGLTFFRSLEHPQCTGRIQLQRPEAVARPM